MAAGDITYDTKSVHSAGDHFVVTGKIEADTTARKFDLVSGSLLYCTLTCTTDDATNDTRSTLNTTEDFSTASDGSLGVQAEAADTFRFAAGYLPG